MISVLFYSYKTFLSWFEEDVKIHFALGFYCKRIVSPIHCNLSTVSRDSGQFSAITRNGIPIENPSFTAMSLN